MDNFIPDYPPQDSQTVQRVISSKNEFIMNAARVAEPTPARGELYAHQRLFVSLVRTYDKILLIAEPGTGKSLSFLAALEHFKKSGLYRKAYVFEKGPLVLRDVQQQLACKAVADGVYDNAAVAAAKPETKRSVLRRQMKPFYSFQSYLNLVNVVNGHERARAQLNAEEKMVTHDAVVERAVPLTDAELSEKFSGTIFVIDEAHNLVTSNTATDLVVYETFKRVLSVAKRIKVILATATPMTNSVSEIGSMMNLILPPERSFPSDFDFEKADYNTLEPYFRGLVSYVRAETVRARAVFKGKVLAIQNPATSLASPTVYMSEMSPFQVSVYGRFASRIRTEDVPTDASIDFYDPRETRLVKQIPVSDTDSVQEKDTFFNNALQSGLFVFPDGTFGGIVGSRINSGISTFVRESPTERGSAVYEWRNDQTSVDAFEKFAQRGRHRSLSTWIAPRVEGQRFPDLKNLKTLSCKHHAILSIEFERIDEIGAAFIFADLKNGGGAILTGLLFKTFGIEQFIGNRSELEESDVAGKGICNLGSSSSSTEDDIVSKIPKRLRFAYLLPENEPHHDVILRVFNSRANFKGEYIRFLIGSRFSRDGINLYNCTRVHLLMPGWTPAGTTQSIYRAIRTMSQDVIYNYRLVHHAVPGETPAGAAERAIVDVNVFKHCATAPYEAEKSSIDAKIYIINAVKDFYIRRMMTILKRCSLDCALNYYRNVTYPFNAGQMKDFSQACDYQKCEFKCGSEKNPVTIPAVRDYESFDILYYGEEMEKAKREIVGFFAVTKLIEPISYSDLHAKTTVRESSFFRALRELIVHRFTLRDFFGREAVLSATSSCRIFTNPFFQISGGSGKFPDSQIDECFAVYCIRLFPFAPQTLSQIVYENDEVDKFEIFPYAEYVAAFSENASCRPDSNENFTHVHIDKSFAERMSETSGYSTQSKPEFYRIRFVRTGDTSLRPWRYVTIGSETLAVENLLKRERQTAAEAVGDEPDEEVYGFVDPKTKKFKIVDRRDKQRGALSRGRDCSSRQIQDIISILLHIEPDVEPETFATHTELIRLRRIDQLSETELADAVIANETTIKVVPHFPEHDVRLILKLTALHRETLCEYLQTIIPMKN